MVALGHRFRPARPRSRVGRQIPAPAPGYDGPLPEGGILRRPVANYPRPDSGSHVLENNDPKPAAEAIKKFTKVYPYEAGGVGTPIAAFLSGKAKLRKISDPPPTVFHEVSGKAFSTIPPNDFSYFEMLNELVQQEPATSLDPELMDHLPRSASSKASRLHPMRG